MAKSTLAGAGSIGKLVLLVSFYNEGLRPDTMNPFVYLLVLLGLTCSFSVVYLPLEPLLKNLPYLSEFRWATIVWLILVSIGFRIYTHRTIKSALFEAPSIIGWRKTGAILLPLYVVTAILAVVFPSPKHSQADMVFIVAIGPIGEELIFRGIMWDFIIKHLKRTKPVLGITPVLFITSLLFGAMHWQYLKFQLSFEALMTIAFTGTMGLAFGKIRKESGTLSVCILSHLLFNSFWNLFLRTGILSFLD